MANERKPTRLRRVLRWCRVLVLLGVLLLVIAGLYLNLVGLPDFLKRPLLTKLREQGVEVDFSRMRLRWYRGIVVDDAIFTFLKQPLRPKFSSTETELNLNYRSLLDSKLKLDSLQIKQGNFLWPVSATNQFSFSNLTAHIRFGAKEEINVTQLQADFIGAQINVVGSVTNASALRDWKIFQPKRTEKKGGLEKFATALGRVRLSGHPQLALNFSGDAADPKSFRAALGFSAGDADTPWGKGNAIQLNAQLRNLTIPENNFVRLKINSAETIWGSSSNANFFVKLLSVSNDFFQTELKISAKQLATEFGKANSAQLSARSTQSLTNFAPINVTGTVGLVDAQTKWGKVASAELVFAGATNTSPKIAENNWGAWSKAEPFHFTWETRLAEVESPKIKMEKVFCSGSWLAPELIVSKLEAQLFEGGIQLAGKLNVATRAANAKIISDFDPQKVSPFLTPFGQRWIAKYTWETPPKVEGNLRVVLPVWTNAAPNWREEVLPTLWLDGNVSVGRGSYREVTATSARTEFTYSNLVWSLPHLRVDRPEGGADLSLIASDRTREYHWRIHSQIDPRAIRHLLGEKPQRVFDDFQFTTPPTIRAELYGHWYEMEKTSGAGEVIAKNFSYRSNSIDQLTCSFSFTNQILQATEGRLEHDGKFITAQKVELALPTKRLFFTNVYSTVDPYLVTRLIGRKVAKHIEPYQFAEPPAVRLNGGLTIGETDDADLHFTVDGTQFHWTYFNADRIAGQIDWVGEKLSVTNVVARAYGGGRVAGWLDFDFSATPGADYRFDIAAGDIDVRSVVKSFKGKTNRLEGMLHGQMTLESGNTSDLKTMRGNGRVNLRDGLLWDVPLFGVLSPMLNAILPGSGNSRAREASAKFVVRDGIVYTDDLAVRSATMRLQYQGAVDFQQRLDARVEADLLRDTWLVGKMISVALSPLSKLFEYRVTGTLAKPESEPVYIPNFLMMTLRPFHTIKKALGSEKHETSAAPTLPVEPTP